MSIPAPLLHRLRITTPLGQMLALASDRGLCALEFPRESRTSSSGERADPTGSLAPHERLRRRLQQWFPAHEIVDDDTAILERTCDWLTAYFDGTSADTRDFPLDLRGAPFERRVWAALIEIPAGRTSSYGAIAKKLNAPAASRAVGAANGANPVSIIVPCHRVIGASGALTGYGGGLDRKKWLLAHEAGHTGTLF